ncbi:MAG: asparagine synthase (glutamine-hydrolyzing) [Oligoflexia bacterium]|nr:asparagine synthase (glutamine-hydrolyzing) [Oligoflexia bacterium]
MCGIAGIFLGPGELAREEELGRMARAMRRRGPDAQGVHVTGAVGLAHRRLSIIDLSEGANQPLFNEDGRIAVVFNGEIYNFQELRGELERAGHRFATRSDTEIIVHGFEEWGIEAFDRFNGMFALALWDGREGRRELILARDPFGVKPLFYSITGGAGSRRLAFASELKPLLQLPWIGRELDRESVFQFLKFSHVPNPRSILKEVRQLRPGTWLRYSERGVEEGRLAIRAETARDHGASGEKESRDEASLLRELDRVLTESVRRQLVSDVPVGCFLSGGVDSSLLIAACGASGSAIETFSIGYREKEYDETGYARQVAEAFGTRHHELVAGPRDYIDLVPEVPEFFDQPFADPTLLSSVLLARFARERVKVALSGDGGDELFFGYPYQRALLHLWPVEALPGAARRALFGAAGRLLSGLGNLGARGRSLQQAMKLADILRFESQAELIQSFIGTVGPLPLARLAELVPGDFGLEGPYHGPLIESLAGLPRDQRITQVYLRTFLVDTVLAKTDRATMACGLEARVPFLDREMAAFAARVPFELKLRRGILKYLPRRLLAGKFRERGLPTDLAWRAKQGFSIPLREWLRTDLKYLVDEYLDEERLRREGLFAPKAVRGLVREHLQERANHSHLLWSLISFRMWKERHLS